MITGIIALGTDLKGNRCHWGYIDEALQTLKTRMPDNWVDKAHQASLDWRAKKGNEPSKVSISAYERVRIGMRSPLDAEDAELKSGDDYESSPHHSDYKSPASSAASASRGSCLLRDRLRKTLGQQDWENPRPIFWGKALTEPHRLAALLACRQFSIVMRWCLEGIHFLHRPHR